jgi:uncharacterized protein
MNLLFLGQIAILFMMSILAIFLCGALAGLFGALVGLGGGIIIVPVLTLIFNVPIKYAVATSLISVCATSIGGAAKYLKQGKADFRLGLFLETTTVAGALIGGFLAVALKSQVIGITFSLMLLYTSAMMIIKKDQPSKADCDLRHIEPAAPGKYYALGLSFIGGIFSSFLGVGGGVIKVPVLNLILKMPIALAAATSTYMIGITTAAGSIVYLVKGMVDYKIVAPLILGTYIGSSLGATVAGKTKSRVIKFLFIAVAIYSAFSIGLKELGVKLF